MENFLSQPQIDIYDFDKIDGKIEKNTYKIICEKQIIYNFFDFFHLFGSEIKKYYLKISDKDFPILITEKIIRKNNEIKYKIITDTEIKKEKFYSYFLPYKQDKPAIIEKDNSIIINSLYNNNFIELKSENNKDFSLTNISEKDKFKEIINKNFDFFCQKSIF